MSRTRRIPLILTISAVSVAIIALGVVFLPKFASGLGIGAALEEANGQTHTTHYSQDSTAPARDTPTWFPKAATNLTLEVPGPHSKGPGGVQLDADVPASFSLPGNCTPSPQDFPWAGGWKDVQPATAPLEKCGGWIALVQHQHLYAWR